MNMNTTKQRNKSKKKTRLPIMQGMISDLTMLGKGSETPIPKGEKIMENLLWGIEACWFSAMKTFERMPVTDPSWNQLFDLLDEVKCTTIKHRRNL